MHSEAIELNRFAYEEKEALVKHRLLSIGECMVELTDLTPMSLNKGFCLSKGFCLNKGFAGDTFNMAFYARLALPQDWAVDYYTELARF